LIAIVGATIANTGVLTFDSCCPDSLVGIQAEEQIRLLFLEYYLRSEKHKIRNISYSSGGQPNINLRVLNPYPIPLPPLDEQYKIVETIEEYLLIADNTQNSININMKYIHSLRDSILRHAFEGRLVLQDPNDEPASVLLERIRAERAVHAPIRGKRIKGNTPYQMRLTQ